VAVEDATAEGRQGDGLRPRPGGTGGRTRGLVVGELELAEPADEHPGEQGEDGERREHPCLQAWPPTSHAHCRLTSAASSRSTGPTTTRPSVAVARTCHAMAVQATGRAPARSTRTGATWVMTTAPATTGAGHHHGCPARRRARPATHPAAA